MRGSIAKITRPHLADYFPRKRLFGVIEQARSRPAVWITGPPGSGKTTLVGSYIEHRRLTCLWYQVDEGDGDPATFFYYLGLAVEHAAPQERKPLPLLTPEYAQGLATFARNFFRESFARLKPPFIVVFDNYQEAPADALLHEVIREGLLQIPDGGTVILISRGEPPAAVARLRMNNLIETIGWEGLRLTVEESMGIAHAHGYKRMTDETLRRLHADTHGWTAGLVLLLEQTRGGPSQIRDGEIFVPELLFDYFADEILIKTNLQTQDFLLKTAFLPQISVSQAEALTGQHTAGAILSGLTRKNYFTVRHAQPEPVYQYHPLFREFLLGKAKATIPAGMLDQIRERAADLLETAGQVEHAVALLRDTKAWEPMLAMILRHAETMLYQGRTQPLERWIRALPAEIVDSTPWLPFWLGSCRLALSPLEARTCFTRAFELFKVDDDGVGSLLAWAGIIDTYIYAREDYHPLDRWIEAFRDLQVHFDGAAPAVQARAAIGMFCALMYRRPGDSQLPLWEARVIAAALHSPDIRQQMMIGHNLLLYYTWFITDQAKAGKLVDMLRPRIDTPGIAPLALIGWHAIEAIYLWMTGAFGESLNAVRRGLETADTTGVRVMNNMLNAQGVWAATTSGDLHLAREFLGKIAPFVSPDRHFDFCHYQCQCHIVAWEEGDMPRATEYAQSAYEAALATGVPFVIAGNKVFVARVLHAKGERGPAWAYLQEALAIAEEIKCEGEKYGIYYHQVLFALAENRTEAALTALRRYLSLGRQYNYINHPYWSAGPMTQLCVMALQHEIEVDYVRSLIRTRQLVPQTPPVEIPNWPWALQVFTLGEFSIIKDNEPLTFARKSQKRTLDLLKALIAMGGRAVVEERLIEALWPDADGDAAHQAFATALHRLRRLIGNDVVERRDGRLTLDPRYCWVDCWALERLLDEIAANGVDPEASRRLEQVIALCRGTFLAGSEEPWAISCRERLRSKFLRILTAHSEKLRRSGEYAVAASLYEKALEVDDLAEECYQGLMLCYQALGRRAEALAVYQRCYSTLTGVLGVEPSARTEALRRALQQP